MAGENIRIFESGDFIFREGEIGNRMYILIEGAVELRMKVEGAETLLKTVDTPNDFFGEMALLDSGPRSASAMAVRHSRVLVVDGPTFESLILSNGKFALKVIKILADRLRRSNIQVSELIETMPRERVARGLVDFALKQGEKTHDGGIKVNVDVLKAWINSHLGASMNDIDLFIGKAVRDGNLSWVPSKTQSHENLILSPAFVRANNRRL